MLHLIFYVFAGIAIASGVAVITAHNPVRSVLSLVVTFIAMAGVWMILRAEFLALILILVYVGAVMTLFLFVVMMLNIDKETKQSGFVRYLPYSLLIILLLMGITVIAVGPDYFGMTQMPAPAAESPEFSNLQQLGAVLYTDYVFPFEVAGVILLVAIIASITLTHRSPRHRRVQDISEQVATQRNKSVKLIRFVGGEPAGEATPETQTRGNK